ncbi:DMT family transporter [Polycladidibacter stylochi]|uniref:DMT family transporter n=1 Tax=Polycladidibacter stylochi TaxID=1807766 RepID=UPI00082A4943|nr:DMT family transporter [Pseudovibrio stylochi]
MLIYEGAAVLAATCWAITGLVSSKPAGHLGAIGFNFARMWSVVVMLAAYTLISGSWQTLSYDYLPLLFISGFIGIFVGDTALFLTLNRLGPRRTSIIFAMNAPISVILGALLFGEKLSIQEVSGILLVIVGVVLAIAFGKRKDQLHQWEAVKGPLVIGVGLGLVAATSQSIGSLAIKPIMSLGADPLAVALVRCTIAAIGLSFLVSLPSPMFKFARPMTINILGFCIVSGFLGMGVGMSFLLFALEGGEVGIVSTLSATSPAILLPLLWWRTGQAPAIGAWIGAFLVIIGCALIFRV